MATANPEDSAAQDEAIKTAKVVFRYIAETYVESSAPQAPVVHPKTVPKPTVKAPSFLASACSFQRPVTATSTTSISKCTLQEELADELDRYLRFDGSPTDDPEVLLNPLLWWKIYAAEYPTLARMARDYLAIPATSVSVERIFSKSRHICSNLRSLLKESIRMALLTKAWIRSGLFEMMPKKALRRKHGEVVAVKKS